VKIPDKFRTLGKKLVSTQGRAYAVKRSILKGKFKRVPEMCEPQMKGWRNEKEGSKIGLPGTIRGGGTQKKGSVAVTRGGRQEK